MQRQKTPKPTAAHAKTPLVVLDADVLTQISGGGGGPNGGWLAASLPVAASAAPAADGPNGGWYVASAPKST